MTTTLDLIRQTGRLEDAQAVRKVAAQQGQQLRQFVGKVADQRAQTPTINFVVVDELAKTVPVGFYALPMTSPTTNNDVTFFEVREFRGGHRITMVIGAPGSFRVQTLKLNLQYHALRHIAEDLVAASALFGHKTRTCGRCKSPLTRTDSRERGMGRDCWDARMEGR